MQIIPSASTPVDGNCTSDQNTFSYVQTENGNSYNISFCLGNTTGTLTPGPKCLTPGGIVDVDCSGGGGGGPIGDSFSCPGDPVVQYDGGSYDSDGLSSTTGGYYRTVQIGTQCWLRENLKTTKYNDNTPILNLTDESDWANNTTGAYSCFNNSTANCDTYGALYNFYAVDFASNGGKNLCPSGWRVPSRTDWNNLYIFLGSDAQVGYKLKSSDDWDGNNSSGFSALPTGFRDFEGSFGYSTNAYFWSASIMDASKAWFRIMQTGNPEFNETYDMFGYGFPIRCLED